ncbi:hypothetical protein Rs2_19765 [Raphanus sativus]|nr:hypothetical protein Rs2_19765 [Raphanus sativus]
MLKLLTSTAYGGHHVNSIKSPLFKTLSQLTGLNRSSHELAAKLDSEVSHTKSSSGVVSKTPNLEDYQTVIALPVLNKPLFPGFCVPIYVKDPKLLAALQESQAPYAGVFLLKDDDAASTDSYSSSTFETDNVLDKLKGKELFNRLHKFGTLVEISSIKGKHVSFTGRRRLCITDMVSEDPLFVKVDHIKDNPYDKDDDVIKATYYEVMSTLRSFLQTSSHWRNQAQDYTQASLSLYFGTRIADFSYQHLADFGVGISGANKHQHQEVLEELDVHKRLMLSLELLKKEVEINKIQASVAKTVEDKFSGARRRVFLNEQLTSIKKELGVVEETDRKSSLSEKYTKRIDLNKDKIPNHVLEVIEEELAKLHVTKTSSSEFKVTLNYLDWLTVLPWGNLSDENFDVLRAEKILEEDHYGLSDVKERILEFIAVGSLRGTSKDHMSLRPSWSGKTSIGRSIARALDRKFYRFSVGGLTDVHEINGHRRTYVGAMPGKIVQCLKTVGTENPLILIDEIDKLGKKHSDDPASALLEVMDPEQNANFRDHYLDVTIDLSKVLFVCTANVTDKIPKPLLDRMEVIHLAGYVTDEKMHIARDYLVKATCVDCGIKPEQVDVTDAALLSLIENYCREAGVRNLQKHIEKIYRKIALKLVRQKASVSVEDTKPLAKTDSESLESIETKTKQRGVVAETVEKIYRKIAHKLVRLKASESTVLTDESATKTEQKRVVAETVEKVMVEESNLVDYVGKPVFRADKIYEQTPVELLWV